MLRRMILAAAFAAAFATPSFAQEQAEEIIVTGSRLETYDSWPVPHVFITRRADFAVVGVEVRNDTRQDDARRAEMIEALRRLEEAARRAGMTLAIADENNDIVRNYTQAAAEQLMRAGYRADTTVLTIRIRTPVAAADTLESIHDRVERFVEAAPKPGRVEMAVGRTDLSMVDLEQYRGVMLEQILAEGRELARRIGGAQGVTLGGLESQVAFQRTGDLDLILFLPYTLSVDLAAAP